MAKPEDVEPPYGGLSAYPYVEQSLSRWRKIATSKFSVSNISLRNVLHRVPSLPSRLPRGNEITGYATWSNQDTSCSFSTKNGSLESLRLTKTYHTVCKISPSSNFRNWNGNKNNGIALLVAGWAYILTADLAKRQNFSIEYSPLPSQPNPKCSTKLELKYASKDEIRWWKSLITPEVGWTVEGQRTSPWALSIECLGVHIMGESASSQNPPSAEQAAGYLHRLCLVFGLGSQSTAALAAALSIPLHADIKRRGPASISLPAPSLTAPIKQMGLHGLPPELQDLGRYMTLSLSTLIFGASLWGIFWEPDVPCNHAGAWLTPLGAILEPIIQDDRFEDLVKVTSVSSMCPLWLGVAICGRSPIITRIVPFLTALAAYPEFQARTTAAAWTGVSLSFMDFYRLQPARDETVSRADVWRLRYECSEAYSGDHFTSMPLYPWPPFGRMRVSDVELEIQDHINCAHEWTYEYWRWDCNQQTDPGIVAGPQHFTFDNSEVAGPNLNDRRNMAFAECPLTYRISKRATENIFGWSSSQVERGFGGVLVPRRFGPDEPVKAHKPRQIDHKAIEEWRKEVS